MVGGRSAPVGSASSTSEDAGLPGAPGERLGRRRGRTPSKHPLTSRHTIELEVPSQLRPPTKVQGSSLTLTAAWWCVREWRGLGPPWRPPASGAHSASTLSFPPLGGRWSGAQCRAGETGWCPRWSRAVG